MVIENVAHTCSEILRSLQKKEILSHAATLINLKNILLSPVSNSQMTVRYDSTHEISQKLKVENDCQGLGQEREENLCGSLRGPHTLLHTLPIGDHQESPGPRWSTPIQGLTSRPPPRQFLLSEQPLLQRPLRSRPALPLRSAPAPVA